LNPAPFEARIFIAFQVQLLSTPPPSINALRVVKRGCDELLGEPTWSPS